MAFTVIGTLIPAVTKQREIANTTYYQVINTATDKDTYKPCENVQVTVQRAALIDLAITSIRELNLIRADGFEEIFSDKIEKVAESGTHVVTNNLPLPCVRRGGLPMESGQYFWEMTIEYTVEGRKKFDLIRTPVFNVVTQLPI